MRDKIFIVVVAFILLFFPICSFMRPEKDISTAENRSLFKKSDIKLLSLNDDLNSFLQDQFFCGERIKKVYNIGKNKVINVSMKLIEKTNMMELIPMGNKIFRLANSDYLVYRPKTVDEKKDTIIQVIQSINDLSDKHENIKFYFYNNVTDSTVNSKKEFDDFIINNLNDDIPYLSSTTINSYDDYKRCFYKTDHHWNKNGQYEGYTDIVNLLEIENPLEITGTHKFEGIKFYGSKDRAVGNYDIYDDFEVNLYNYPDMKVEIDNKEVDDYGKSNDFFAGNIPEGNVEENYYGDFYGWDDGIIKIKVDGNDEKDNLVIFSNSYSNPLNKLIASSFNETYIIDLRNYEKELGEEFDVDKFFDEHKIDRVLILANYNYYTDEDSIIKIGE